MKNHKIFEAALRCTNLLFPSYNSDLSPYRWMIAPLCIGYLSHLVEDALTPSGVLWLYPKRKTYRM
ncbi:MAG: metal-dependent hydrolase [Cyanobacteria bacterium J06555_3]